MATLTVKNIVQSGLVSTLDAVNSSDKFFNDGNTYLHVKNGSGSSINVTLTTPGKQDGVDISDPVIAVPAGAEVKIGALAPRTYNDAQGYVTVTYSSTTTVTAGAFHLGN